MASLWADVLALFIAERRSDGAPIGYLSATRADFRNGHCHMSVFAAERFQRSLYPAEGAALFMVHVMRLYPFRKIYFELPEFNATELAHSLRSVAKVEGRLLDHEYHDGRYWDLLIASAGRDVVADRLAPLVGQTL